MKGQILTFSCKIVPIQIILKCILKSMTMCMKAASVQMKGVIYKTQPNQTLIKQECLSVEGPPPTC